MRIKSFTIQLIKCCVVGVYDLIWQLGVYYYDTAVIMWSLIFGTKLFLYVESCVLFLLGPFNSIQFWSLPKLLIGWESTQRTGHCLFVYKGIVSRAFYNIDSSDCVFMSLLFKVHGNELCVKRTYDWSSKRWYAIIMSIPLVFKCIVIFALMLHLKSNASFKNRTNFS